MPHLARGLFRRDPVAAPPPVEGERLIGWIAHCLIGIAFAAMLLAICGLDRAALIVGIGSVDSCLRDSGSKPAAQTTELRIIGKVATEIIVNARVIALNI